MTPRLHRSFLVLGTAALTASSSVAQTLISDSFEVDSSVDYTVVNDGTPDGSQTFAIDYVSLGIPAAPRSAPGDVGGLQLTANETAGAADAFTLFHTTPITADQYRLTVDVWMNFVATASGTTEFAHVGVGGDGATFNQVFTPISGSGAFLSFTGDGGSGSDYRWFRSPANTPPGESANTTLPNSHPSYRGNGSNNTGSFFQSLFPSPPATIAGSPGNIWTTVTIEVDNLNGRIAFAFDGVLTFRGDFAGRFDGFASLGIADVFSSIGPTNFTLYDNFLVEAVDLSLGNNLCQATANSTGSAGAIGAFGSTDAAANDLTLVATSVPDQVFGIFLASRTGGSIVSVPMGSQGPLCLDGSIARLQGQGTALLTENNRMSSTIDITMIPEPTPSGTQLVPILAGETWYFQAWFRDVDAMGASTSNLTDSLEIQFQ